MPSAGPASYIAPETRHTTAFSFRCFDSDHKRPICRETTLPVFNWLFRSRVYPTFQSDLLISLIASLHLLDQSCRMRRSHQVH